MKKTYSQIIQDIQKDWNNSTPIHWYDRNIDKVDINTIPKSNTIFIKHTHMIGQNAFTTDGVTCSRCGKFFPGDVYSLREIMSYNCCPKCGKRIFGFKVEDMEQL